MAALVKESIEATRQVLSKFVFITGLEVVIFLPHTYDMNFVHFRKLTFSQFKTTTINFVPQFQCDTFDELWKFEKVTDLLIA